MAAKTPSIRVPGGRALLAVAHQRPLPLDDDAHVVADRGANGRAAGVAERVAVTDDRREAVGLGPDVVTGGS